MKKQCDFSKMKWSIISGVVVGLAAMLLTVGMGVAAPPEQDAVDHTKADPQTCGECHLDVATSWSTSPHAHAFSDRNFSERWLAMGEPGECLLCHTTNYQATTNSYAAEGVSCEACHGQVDPKHPPAAAPIQADTEYCGTCHTTTLGEWRLTGHAHAGVGCTDCHDPHSQQALFANKDEMCINCHKDSMDRYLEDLHLQKNIGCVDCHALVIPPKTPPADGIVPTGHTFTITAGTCVACHTDSLHAGFSLPGYENGAKQANGGSTQASDVNLVDTEIVQSPEERIQVLENQVSALDAKNKSWNMSLLFQGAVVGLVFGGTTAWLVANNVRRGRKEDELAK